MNNINKKVFKKNRKYFLLFSLFLFFLTMAHLALASRGTNYYVENPEAPNGPSNNLSNSTNYRVLSEIGDTVVGESSSSNFSVRHGVVYDLTGNTVINIIAVPEKRVPDTGNDDSHVIIEVRLPGNTTPIFKQTIDTDTDGEYANLVLTGVNPGVYDITAKAYSHLRRKKVNISVSSSPVIVDFSDARTNKLLCGDVNLTEGDNKVNSLDMTILVDKWNSSDERSDLNQDGQVNSLDMTNMVTNFNKVGDD